MPLSNSALIIHSDAPFRHRVSSGLARLGINCTEISDCSNLVSVERSQLFACIVLDLTPFPSNKDILTELKGSGGGRSPVIIGVVTDSSLRAVVRAMKAGANEIVSMFDHEAEIVEVITAAIAEADISKDASTHSFTSKQVELPALLQPERSQIRRYDEYEEEIFRYALKQCGGCVSRAAVALGVGRATMYRKIRSYQIEVPPVGQRTLCRSQSPQIPVAVG